MQPLVIGVVNVTPDSFSDGGRWADHDAAIAHGLQLFEEGADIVDVGGESTRPGAAVVDEIEERRRIEPVVAALSARGRVSIDTGKAGVAEAAVAAGATLVNDVTASLAPVAASLGVGWVAMHRQGTAATMQLDPRYDDVVAEVRRFLVAKAEQAVAAGVTEVWIDPGIGFGKTVAHNLALLARLGGLVATGYPVMVGTSRKGFLGVLAGGAPADDRLEPSLATAVWAMAEGAAAVRVHDVAATIQAARIVGQTVPGGFVKGKWAKGIEPRYFAWVIKDQLAVSERPGGYARNHRRVRRQEEILWIRSENFSRVVSLLSSPHNLHAYDELGVPWSHFPFGPNDDARVLLPELYRALHTWLADGERVIVHMEELGDRLMGVMAGYLLYAHLLPTGPQAIAVTEQILHRQMGPAGRELVAVASTLA